MLGWDAQHQQWLVTGEGLGLQRMFGEIASTPLFSHGQKQNPVLLVEVSVKFLEFYDYLNRCWRLSLWAFILRRAVGNDEVGKAICAGAAEYASSDPATRVGIRARIVKLIDSLGLKPQPLRIRTISGIELQSSQLRGSLIMHLDLASRSPQVSSELFYTAAAGRILVAEHDDIEGFPVGVCLLLPMAQPPVGRGSLFNNDNAWGNAPMVVAYGLATNPGGLGAGRALCEAAAKEAGGAQLLAYAPLTGLRARIIQVVDDAEVWAAASSSLSEGQATLLKSQLTDLLGRDTVPESLEEPAVTFLQGEAREFATSERYRVGQFHKHMGGRLAGVDDASDPSESDSMWARAYFEY